MNLNQDVANQTTSTLVCTHTVLRCRSEQCEMLEIVERKTEKKVSQKEPRNRKSGAFGRSTATGWRCRKAEAAVRCTTKHNW